jgi:hypothetical protein
VSGLPAVLEDVPLDEHVRGVLRLEEILFIRAPLIRFPVEPLEKWLRRIVDVARDQAGDVRIATAEGDVLARRFEEVVLDLERPGLLVDVIACASKALLQFATYELMIALRADWSEIQRRSSACPARRCRCGRG